MNTHLVLLLGSAYEKDKKGDGVPACRAPHASHALVCTLPTLYQVAPAGRGAEDIPKIAVAAGLDHLLLSLCTSQSSLASLPGSLGLPAAPGSRAAAAATLTQGRADPFLQVGSCCPMALGSPLMGQGSSVGLGGLWLGGRGTMGTGSASGRQEGRHGHW